MSPQKERPSHESSEQKTDAYPTKAEEKRIVEELLTAKLPEKLDSEAVRELQKKAKAFIDNNQPQTKGDQGERSLPR
jgi:hypothetical protein